MDINLFLLVFTTIESFFIFYFYFFFFGAEKVNVGEAKEVRNAP